MKNERKNELDSRTKGCVPISISSQGQRFGQGQFEQVYNERHGTLRVVSKRAGGARRDAGKRGRGQAREGLDAGRARRGATATFGFQ
ncbi:unnamed protein product, partial [Iphiclides podalirius]